MPPANEQQSQPTGHAADAPQAADGSSPRRGLAFWVATSFGVGLIPFAPGTFGSLVGLPVAYAIGLIPNAWVAAIALAVLVAVGVPICSAAIRQIGGPHDPGCVVFDEVAGVAATLFLHDVRHPAILIGGFLLFRFFDILKPSPARDVERLPAGWGVMADDLVAAVYANLSLHALAWLVPWIASHTTLR